MFHKNLVIMVDMFLLLNKKGGRIVIDKYKIIYNGIDRKILRPIIFKSMHEFDTIINYINFDGNCRAYAYSEHGQYIKNSTVIKSEPFENGSILTISEGGHMGRYLFGMDHNYFISNDKSIFVISNLQYTYTFIIKRISK